MRRAVVVALAATLALAATPPAQATEEPTPDPTEDATTAFTLDDAQLAWGLNLEASNRAFAPGTVNVLGAGAIDPGGGGRTLTQAAWRQRAGAVRIEKANARGDYERATWAGLTTQSDGEPLGTPTAGTFSHHRVVLDGGTGTVDPEAGTARIAWDGTFSVLFYSGMSTFTVTDPELVVTRRSAQLRGTLGGWASSMDDASRWEPLEPTTAVLAVLDRGALRLPAEGGTTATPAYGGVRYDAPRDAAPQVRSGEGWGSWPRSFVTFQQRAGSASYWYSSGGATDRWKAATPLTVSWEAGDPLDPPAPPPPTDPGDVPDDPDAPDAPAPPPGGPGPGPGGAAPSPQTTPRSGGTTPTGRRTADPAAALAPAAVPPPVARDLSPVAAPATTPDPDHRWHWWLGALLLGAAALLTPPVRSRTTPTRTNPRGTR